MSAMSCNKRSFAPFMCQLRFGRKNFDLFKQIWKCFMSGGSLRKTFKSEVSPVLRKFVLFRTFCKPECITK